MVSTKDKIITNLPFQYSRPLSVILGVSRRVDFDDTMKVLFIGT